MDIFVARQPIFNRQQDVIAYELLYRESERNAFSGNVASDVATSILLTNTYVNFGIDNLIGDQKAFVNFDKLLIMNDVPQLLNKDNVVIELLEDIVPDPAFMKKLEQLKEMGYTLAIDDVIQDYPHKELIEIADIIKVEFMGQPKEAIENICRLWKPRGKLLLAEKVETIEDFNWAKSMGFDFFQGYFFSKPILVSSKVTQGNKVSYLRLMNAMSTEEPDYKQISQLIEVDAGITYKLLKLVNSRFSKKNAIKTIQHALAMLGINAMKKWVSLAMMQQLSSDDSSEIMTSSMVRSTMLEAIAVHSSLKSRAEDVTLMGVLSMLNVVMKKPMEELLKDLPVAEDIKIALTGGQSPLTPAYKLCTAYEKGQFSSLDDLASSIGYDPNQLPRDYVNAIKWADDTYKELYEEKDD